MCLSLAMSTVRQVEACTSMGLNGYRKLQNTTVKVSPPTCLKIWKEIERMKKI